MAKLEIFIYRPERQPNPNVIPDLCYTLKGQNYRDWQRDQEEVYHYKVEQIKRKLNKRPKHKVLDYWR